MFRDDDQPMKPPPDDRSALALAYGWAVRITAISLEMVVPILIGLWLDRKLGTVLVFVVLGAVVGVTAGLFHLIRLAGPVHRCEAPHRKSLDDHPK
jgi:F0F1-type ATP synthase assembly protein I